LKDTISVVGATACGLVAAYLVIGRGWRTPIDQLLVVLLMVAVGLFLALPEGAYFTGFGLGVSMAIMANVAIRIGTPMPETQLGRRVPLPIFLLMWSELLLAAGAGYLWANNKDAWAAPVTLLALLVVSINIVRVQRLRRQT
jgi:hypothetical protein